MKYILAIDQGTTNSRAILFDTTGKLISQHEMNLQQFYPQPSWVEQDPEEMVSNTILCCREAVKKSNIDVKDIVAVGITNQRETTILWDKTTGKPIYPAIVWLDRRTSEMCKTLAQTSLSTIVPERTGLLLDPYFSATKIKWIFDYLPAAHQLAKENKLLFGTVDTYLLWKLTNGKSHATDATNASRTMLFDIRKQCWDEEILSILDIPKSILPEVLDNTAHFGEMDASILGINIPIAGMAGDQQAATIGQACFTPGMVKVTYGTGCFMLLNTGTNLVMSANHLLSTIAYRINHQVTYGLEGSIFSAGTTVKWLRDNLKLFKSAAETESIVSSVQDTLGVYLVPAFSGLGAPYWDPEARGAIVGLTYGAKAAHIVRAGLESVAYQTYDLLHAMTNDHSSTLKSIRADGGMAVNNWFLQFVADMLNITVERPVCIETTALGAAYLAGLQVGVYSSLSDISQHWQQAAEFKPSINNEKRMTLYQGWKNAIKQVIE